MDAAKEAKAAKIASLTTMAALPPVTDASVASKENKETGLPGRVAGLDSDGRRAILGSRSLVTIAYGTLEKPIILMDKVNMAMLQHCKHDPSCASRPTHPNKRSAALRYRGITNIYQTSQRLSTPTT